MHFYSHVVASLGSLSSALINIITFHILLCFPAKTPIQQKIAWQGVTNSDCEIA